MLNIKKFRTGMRLTQQQVSAQLNMARSSYSNIENGRREADYKTLIYLADFFDVSTDYLLGRISDERYAEQKQMILLSESEHNVIDLYRKLSPHGIEVITALLDIESKKEDDR